MRKFFLPVLFFILLSAVFAQSNHKQVKIYLKDQNSVRELKDAGIDLTEFRFDKKEMTISTFLTFEDFEVLKKSGFRYDVKIEDWKKFYSEREQPTEAEKARMLEENRARYGIKGFGYGSMGGYYTTSEVYDELDNMRQLYPNLVTEKFSVGQTYQGREMYVVKISDNADSDEDEPEVFFNSLIHAREPAAMMTVMYYMYYLLENYGTDPEVTYLVDNREIYFMPVLNVDGYEYNRLNSPSGGGMYRKNLSPPYGTDLNRNWGYNWGYDNYGSDPSPSSETYRGTAAFSEPETENVRQFVNAHNFKTGLNYHTFSNLLIIPWGYENIETPDSLLYREFASKMTEVNNYTWGTSGEILYEVNGATDDWMYGEQTEKPKAITFTPEVGSDSDGFWPSMSRIFPLAEENLEMNLFITWAAGAFAGVNGAEFTPEYANPGESLQMTPEFINRGLSTAYNLSAVLSSESQHITVGNNEITLDSLQSRETFIPSEKFGFTVDESAPVGQPIDLVVTISSGGTVMSEDVVKFTPGIPQMMFADTYNDPTVMWNITSVPSLPKWEATGADYHSGPVSYTDSKTGEYEDDCNVQLIMKTPVNLTGINSAKLSYYTKYNIEEGWDCGMVLISTNGGTSWTNLEAPGMNDGAGQGAQGSGTPLYDGSQSSWIYEEIDLSSYVNKQVMIKFQLKSDGYITRDGWYLDDIKIYYYGSEPGNTGCYTINYSGGWNLLSVPYSTSDVTIQGNFPSAVSQAFVFDPTAGYDGGTDIYAGEGFWIKFDEAGSSEICGTILDDEVEVVPGWNIIGGNHQAAPVSGITTEPADILASAFFGFSSGYNLADNLNPGQGYWVKASQAGTIKLNNVPAKNNSVIPEAVKLIIADAEGNSTTLYYFGENMPPFETVMPPLPPEGSFDARFSDNTFGTASPTANVRLTGASAPVTLTAAGGDITINGRLIKNGGSISFSEAPVEIYTSVNLKPAEYALEQNYPNPFNPTTVIRYSVKEKTHVELSVYNLLGEKVAALVNEVQDAGVKEVNFNAANFSSGVYFYTIKAGGFTATRKALLVK